MISTEFLQLALLALGSVLAIMLGLFFGHSVWLVQNNLRNRHLLADGRGALATLIDGNSPGEDESLARLRSLPRRLQIRLLAEAALPLAGAHRERLTAIFEQLGLVQWSGQACTSRVWWKRLRAVRILTLLRTGGEHVRSLVEDPHPLVRAQAIEWCATEPDAALIHSLLDHLGDASRLCRFTVQDTLLRIGTPVAGPLRVRLLEPESAGTRNALRIAAGIAGPRFLEPALLHSASPRAETRSAAARLLGAVAGEAAVAQLVAMLGDADAGPRASAAAALGEMGQWTAANAVAPLLRDPAFPVRRAAGLSLRAMGSPGEIFLRRYRTDPDPQASGIATQILDLPDRPQTLTGRR
ncbi:hypothetical protein BH23GEM8_BH23GEM8_07630 [soil metagenome]